MKTIKILISLALGLSLAIPAFSQTPLTSGMVYTYSTSPGNFSYNQQYDFWSVVGIRSSSGSDFNLSLYDNSGYTTLLASSSYAGQAIDFIVGDYHHNLEPQYDYPRVNLYSGSGSYHLEWEDGAEELAVPGINGCYNWDSSHVVKIWDVHLNEGESYDFLLNVTAGTADLGFALFKSNGATYYAGRNTAQISADANGAGHSETFNYTATATDDYGLVVWCNNAQDTADYDVIISTGIASAPISNGIVYLYILLPGHYMYNQTNAYWAVSGLRSPSGANHDLYLYDDANFSTQLAVSTYGSGYIDFVVGDYHHNPTPQWDYLTVVQSSGTGSYHVEWEGGTEQLTIQYNNGPFDWDRSHVVRIWDVTLTSGQHYNFDLSVDSGTTDLGFALFKSEGAAYYAGRSSAQVEADANGAGQSEAFDYTATATDNYGLVVWCNNAVATATYHINISQPSLWVTMTPINPPIVVPANGGSFQLTAAVQRTQAPQAAFYGWARDRYPGGTYTINLLGPVNINPPVGVNVSRQRTQNVPSTWPAGLHWYIGYANPTVSYPATDADSFAWTKSTAGDGGATVWEAINFGEPFPGEIISSAPTSFALMGVTPNPFNPIATISFALPEAMKVTLGVYDVQGRLVTTLVNGLRQAGRHDVTFDGSKLASGVYLYNLKAGSYSATGKMVLMK